jgi:hypothetical protein
MRFSSISADRSRRAKSNPLGPSLAATTRKPSLSKKLSSQLRGLASNQLPGSSSWPLTSLRCPLSQQLDQRLCQDRELSPASTNSAAAEGHAARLGGSAPGSPLLFAHVAEGHTTGLHGSPHGLPFLLAHVSGWTRTAFGLARGHRLRREIHIQSLFLRPGAHVSRSELHGGNGCQLLCRHRPFDLLRNGVRLRLALQRVSLDGLPQRQQGRRLLRRDRLDRAPRSARRQTPPRWQPRQRRHVRRAVAARADRAESGHRPPAR